MKKITLILIIVFFFGILPVNIFAQFEYLDHMINDDQSVYEIVQMPADDATIAGAEEVILKDIEIIWSTDSYVPYDYPGRALPSVDGFVDINVIMNLYKGKAENLQFSWFIDKSFDESQSGYGRKNFRLGIRKGANENHIVMVKIFNDSNSFYLEKSLVIPIVNPEIIVYTSAKNSEFSELAKKTLAIPANKKSYFIAKPFFFSIKKPTDLSYQWAISGQEAIVVSGLSANLLTVTAPKAESRKSAVKNLYLSVTNGWDYSKQSVSKNILMQVK